MNDVNEAKQEADRHHQWGQHPPNTSSWPSDARNVYEAQREWLRKQEEAKRGSSS